MRALVFVYVSLSACIVSSPPPTTYGPPPGGPPPAGDPNASASGDVIVSNAIGSPVALACEQKAANVKGAEHTAWYMQCPPCAATPGGLWGTGIYTDDSRVCAAALHSGALPPTGGVVLVTWLPGQQTYIGSVRNGFKSDDYAHWGRSFIVQGVDATGRPVTPPPEMLPPQTVRMSCDMPGDYIPRDVPTRVICPAGCATGHPFGTDIYTGDSKACAAAIHAGVITDQGGTFTIQVGGPQPIFHGSARNGVTSQDYPKEWHNSFTVAR